MLESFQLCIEADWEACIYTALLLWLQNHGRHLRVLDVSITVLSMPSVLATLLTVFCQAPLHSIIIDCEVEVWRTSSWTLLLGCRSFVILCIHGILQSSMLRRWLAEIANCRAIAQSCPQIISLQHLVHLTATDFDIRLVEGASACAESITKLVLQSCSVDGPWLAVHPELRHLALLALFQDLPLVSAEAQAFFAALGALTRLTFLELVGTTLAAVPASTLRHLSSLKFLTLDGAWTPDAELSPLPGAGALRGVADLACGLGCALRSVPALLPLQMPLLRRLDLIFPRSADDGLWRQRSLSADIDRLWSCVSHRQPPLEVTFVRVSHLPTAVWKRVLQLQRECGCIVHVDG